MAKYVTLPDGTRCYSGANCLRHGAVNQYPKGFFEKTTEEQLKIMETIKNPLADASPVDIDAKIGELYETYHEIDGELSSVVRSVKSYKTYLTYNDGREASYRNSIALLEQKQEKLEVERYAILAEITPYETEFNRRGGWSRGYLVVNTNGHVHSSRNCSTCRPSTRYALLVPYSGMPQDELVNDSGSKACTVCFPDAPVDVLSRAPRLNLSRTGSAAEAEAVDARAAERAERERKKAENSIVGVDGSALVLDDGSRRGQDIKTVRAAKMEAGDIWGMMRAKELNIGRVMNDSYVERQQRNYTTLIESLAHKNNMSYEAQEEDLKKAFLVKFKRDYKSLL